MNTIDMIKDWKESGCKKKYATMNHGFKSPYTVYNNGVGVLFCSYFTITIKDLIRQSEPFTFNESNLNWEWQEIVEEYDINQAFKKAENGDTMISLASGREMSLKDTFAKEEILCKWIEKLNHKKLGEDFKIQDINGEYLFIKYNGTRMLYNDLPACAKRAVDEMGQLMNVNLIKDSPEWLYGYVEIPSAELRAVVEKLEPDKHGGDIPKDVAVVLSIEDIIDFGYENCNYYEALNVKMIPCVIYI